MLQENSWKVSRALVNTYPRVNSLVNAVWSLPDNMNHHLFLPVLNGPHPYHLYPPEEHQQRAAATAPLSFSLAVFLSCWGVEKLLLPATIFLRSPPPISRERRFRLSAQPCRPHKGGTAGLRGAGGALTDSTDNHCNGCRVRKEGGKQLFHKCHHQHPPLRW